MNDVKTTTYAAVSQPRAKFGFAPFIASPLPSQRSVAITRVLDRWQRVYTMRDLALSEHLNKLMVRPDYPIDVNTLMECDDGVPCIVWTMRPGETSPRLFRALTKHLEPRRGACMTYLVDYDQTVECEVNCIYSLDHEPAEVLNIPSATFTFHMLQSSYGRDNEEVTGELNSKDEYEVCLLAVEEGTYTGTVCALTNENKTRNHKRNATSNRTGAEGCKLGSGTGRRQTEEMNRLEETLRNKQEALRRDRENLETSKRKYSQDLSLVSMQLQVASISKSVAFMSASTLGCGLLGAMPMQPQWQQTTHMMNAIAAQSTTSLPPNQSMLNMQQHMMSGNMALYGGGLNGQPNPLAICGPVPQYTGGTAPMQCPQRVDNGKERMYATNAPMGDQCMGPPPHRTMDRNDSRMPPGMDFDGSARHDSGYSNNRGSRGSGRRFGGSDRGGRFDAGSRWSNNEGDNKPAGNFNSNRDSTKSSFDRTGEDNNRYPRRGEVTCNSCHQPGHYASNCREERSQRPARRETTNYYKRSNDPASLDWSRSKPNQLEEPLFSSDQSCEKAKPISSSWEVGEQKKNGDNEPEERWLSSDQSSKKGKPVNNSWEMDEQKQSGGNEERRAQSELTETLLGEGGFIAPSNSPFDEDGLNTLKYQPYFACVAVTIGQTLMAKRTDEDHANINWPLFFVQIQQDAQLDFLEQHLDSLEPSNDLSDEKLGVGTLCISYCAAFNANFRAVITNIVENEVEVLYVDYGNYETVQRSHLKSIDDQTEEVRTHPSMAVPCILGGLDKDTSKAYCEQMEMMQERVSCDLDQFQLSFVAQLPNGVFIVKVVS